MRRLFGLALVLVALAALPASACSLGALDGFSGGSSDDAGIADAAVPPDDATAVDAREEEEVDGAAPMLAGPSCAAIKAAATGELPDGRYRIEPGGGNEPFEAFCDMTTDGGGWMLVTPAMIVEEKKQAVTTAHEIDARGGVILRAYANSQGCGMGRLDNSFVALVRDVPPWSRMRARHDFHGGTACWAILGAQNGDDPFIANLVRFDPAVDVTRDGVQMGGANGDAFDGIPQRCDNDPENFWHENRGIGRRSVVAIVRRGTPTAPAGLGVFASCTEFGIGTGGVTYWEHREIFVR